MPSSRCVDVTVGRKSKEVLKRSSNSARPGDADGRTRSGHQTFKRTNNVLASFFTRLGGSGFKVGGSHEGTLEDRELKMNKQASSKRGSLFAALIVFWAVIAPCAHAVPNLPQCNGGIDGAPSANLGDTHAFYCTEVLFNTSRGGLGSSFEQYYTSVDGGGWTQVADVTTNTDSEDASSKLFDGLVWSVATDPVRFSGVVTADWLLTIGAPDPSNPPAFPRTYDLLLVLVRGQGPQADSVGLLLEDFEYDKLGPARGSFDASFLSTSNQVQGLEVFARVIGGTTPPSGVPEPGSMLLLLIASVAAVGAGRLSMSVSRYQQAVA